MLITGARVAVNACNAVRRDLWIHKGAISFTPIREAEASTLDLDGFLVLPGLINAHDHLELNLFPRLGNGPYANATTWAEDIYHPAESPVKQHLAVPKAVRFWWGAIKNLLSGVTTVGHHNDLHPVVLNDAFPVRVLKRYGWAHSLRFSPDWQSRVRATPREWPFFIHAGEGTDELSREEVHVMARAGALTDSTVLVHGVGISASDLSLLSSEHASLVWCPSSNYFTLGRTLESSVLNCGIPIALGSDSSMTAQGDLLDELHVARRSASAERLFEMVTSEPARILRLPDGFGRISHGGPADLLVVENEGKSPASALLAKHPQLVIMGGRVVLASAAFARNNPGVLDSSLFALGLEGRGRYWIAANIPVLVRRTKERLNEGPYLAGKAIVV